MIKGNKKVVFSGSPLLNYLKATYIEVGLLLNFDVKPELKRKVFDNERKIYRAQINTGFQDE